MSRMVTADDFAVRITLECFHGGPSADLLSEIFANQQMAIRVLAHVGFLAADMAIAAAGGDEDAAKRNILEAFSQEEGTDSP
jgi:hypothetical protein